MNPALLLPAALQGHAVANGSATALEWLEGDEPDPVRRLTYGELHGRAHAVAQSLLALGLEGERVLLPFPPGLDFVVAFVGCLYAGAVPVPAPFPQNRRTLARARAILEDCRPALCIAPLHWIASLRERFASAGACRCAALEELSAYAAGATLPLPDIRPDRLAYLQYTSGTGGTAKGVMITQDNLAHNIAALQSAAYQPASLPLLSWLPHYHDMQLVVILCRSLLIGGRCILMSPVDFLQRPLRWLRAISRFGAYISGGPNFAYEHCLRRVSEADLAGLDLSGWKIAFNSSERLRPSTIDRFERLTAAAGFSPRAWYPAYGLAEATAYVTGVAVGEPLIWRSHPESGHLMASCGRVALDDRVSIVNPADGIPCAPGTIGEICVAGASVTQGYWNRAEANRSLFHPASGDAPRLLRTGDLGFLDENQRLFFTGRIKDLIILRGINHHPEDIEASLDGCHPALRPGELAAFSMDAADATQEHLVVVAELGLSYRQNPDTLAIAEAVGIVVSREHGLALDRLVLLKPGALPKTTSGKIQRGPCRQALARGELDAVAEWNRLPPA